MVNKITKYWQKLTTKNLNLKTVSNQNKIFKHSLKRNSIHKNAVSVIKKLVNAGFEAYLVGGAVRDALRGLIPKDFDIATNAHPEQVRRIFRNSRIIGKRFKLVHVYYTYRSDRSEDLIEVATFRSDNKENTNNKGMIVQDNVYGTLEQDAKRRDFSINALYYDWFEDCIIDYHNGFSDIQNGIIRLIGDPLVRYQEDPVRILRAIRFKSRLDFSLDRATELSIKNTKEMLKNIPIARLFEEYLKLFHLGTAALNFKLFLEYDLLKYLFPTTSRRVMQNASALALCQTALSDTDNRLNEGMSVNRGYLLAVFLWYEVSDIFSAKLCGDFPPVLCMSKKGAKILQNQRKYLSVPKWSASLILDIWVMQVRLQKIKGKNPFRLLEHLRYRAAYDFLCLRYRSGETELSDLVDWWTEFQDANRTRRKAMTNL